MKSALLLLCTLLPSPARILVWRLLGFRVGRGARVSMFSVVMADEIELGDGAVIGPLTLIFRPKRLVLRERCRVSSFVRIMGFGEIVLEPQSFVGLSCLVDCTAGFFLGARSQLGPNGTYYTHGDTGLIFNVRFPNRFEPIRIGDDCWLGMCCVVYPGVSVGAGSLILPGAVLTSSVGSRQAVLPATQALRTVSVDLFTHRVDDAVVLERARGVLRHLASERPGSRIEEQSPERWRLILPGEGEVVFCAGPLSGEAGPADRTAVWQALGEPAAASAPVFHFPTLRVLGPRTPLAESLASFLCERANINFVFAPASRDAL